MTERIQTHMEKALRRQDAISKALREIAENEAAGIHIPEVVRELAEAGIILEKYDPNKSGYPVDRNMI